MQDETIKCAKCGGEMSAGFILSMGFRAARNVSTSLRHLLVEISVARTRSASSSSPMLGPAPTPPGFSQA